MSKCKDCKWWKYDEFLKSFTENNSIAYRCVHPKFDRYVDLGMNQEDGVYFSGDFGCTLFEAKEPIDTRRAEGLPVIKDCNI